jgi:hypothetical protein
MEHQKSIHISMGQSSLARSLASWNVLGVSVPHFTAIHRGRLRLGTPGPLNMEDCSRRSCGTIRSWRCPTVVSLDGSITAADSAVHRLEVRGLCLIQRKAGLVGIGNICTNIKSVRSHKNSENNYQTTDFTRRSTLAKVLLIRQKASVEYSTKTCTASEELTERT